MRDQSAPLPEQRGDQLANLPAHNWGWFMVRGILALILGLVALLFPFSALVAFALLFAAFAFADGVVSLISGIRGARHREERWGQLVFSGLIGIAVGVLYVIWPMLSTISYALVTLALLSAWAVLSGVLQVSAAIRLRREIQGEWLLALSGVLSVILGLGIIAVTILLPGASIVSVSWIIGIWALFVGLTFVGLALRLRKISS